MTPPSIWEAFQTLVGGLVFLTCSLSPHVAKVYALRVTSRP